MKKYLIYKAKNCIAPFLFLTVVALVFYVIPICVSDYSDWNNNQTDIMIYYPFELLHTSGLVSFLSLAALFVPVWMNGYKMSKRSCDMYYSLPITKRQLLAVHYILGFVAIVAAYTVAYLLGFIVLAIKVKHIAFVHYIWFYFALIIPTYILYSVATFFFTRANSIFDGIVFINYAIFALAAVIGIFVIIFSVVTRFKLDSPVQWHTYFLFSPMIFVNDIFSRLAIGSPLDINVEFINYGIGSELFIVISAVLSWYLFHTEYNTKSENCKQISSSVFGYKLAIPLYSVTAYLLCALGGYIVSFFTFGTIFIFSYAQQAIYMRSIKIGWKNFFKLLAYFAGSLVFSIIMWIVQGI